MSDNPIYDYYAQRFGSQVNPDEHVSYLSDDEHRQRYGSNTRYNQLQNHPYNTTHPIAAMGGGYDTEDYIEGLVDGKQNNVMDLQALRLLAKNGVSLNDVLANAFGSVTRRNQVQNYPNNIDDVLYKMTNNTPPPASPKTTRPIVMPYSEYQRQYVPEYYMHDNYDKFVDGINMDDYLRQLE